MNVLGFMYYEVLRLKKLDIICHSNLACSRKYCSEPHLLFDSFFFSFLPCRLLRLLNWVTIFINLTPFENAHFAAYIVTVDVIKTILHILSLLYIHADRCLLILLNFFKLLRAAKTAS